MTARRLIPLALLLCAILAFFYFDLDQYFTFQALKSHRMQLLDFVATYAFFAPLLFIIIYAAIVAMSVPGGAMMTITGGFLFGTIFGMLYVVVAATIGATLLFLIARTALGEPLRAKAGPWLKKMSKGFQDDALHYMLVLRLVPLFPFFVVNLVPAFLGVSTRVYILATFFGIMPGTFVYASVGAGVGSVFDRGETFDPTGILTPEVILALVGLAILALIPVVYKKFKKK